MAIRAALLLLVLAPSALMADIYRRDNGEAIPGTEGITPGPGVQLDHLELQNANLQSRDLSGADFAFSNLTNAYLYLSTLANANLTGAVVTGASFGRTTSSGFTQAQLQSTVSYRAKDLQGIGLFGDKSGWDFSGQNLTNANLSSSTLTNTNFAGAILKNTFLDDAFDLWSANFDSTTVYNQWTVFPAGFNPTVEGLTLAVSTAGDFDADDLLNADDVDMLSIRIGGRSYRAWWLPDAALDLNDDGSIDLDDHRVWVKDLKHTWYGDADLDGEFNSTDLVEVLAAGEYEAPGYYGGLGNFVGASWSDGDWNADGEFNSADLVVALADGGYEAGPRPAAVPEPSTCLLFGLAIGSLIMCRKPVRSPF